MHGRPDVFIQLGSGDDDEDDLDVDDLHGRHHLLIHPLDHVIPREPAVVPHTGKDLIVFAGHLNIDDHKILTFDPC